jgi:hypothetical protein
MGPRIWTQATSRRSRRVFAILSAFDLVAVVVETWMKSVIGFWMWGPKFKGTVDFELVAWFLNDQHYDASVCRL